MKHQSLSCRTRLLKTLVLSYIALRPLTFQTVFILAVNTSDSVVSEETNRHSSTVTESTHGISHLPFHQGNLKGKLNKKKTLDDTTVASSAYSNQLPKLSHFNSRHNEASLEPGVTNEQEDRDKDRREVIVKYVNAPNETKSNFRSIRTVTKTIKEANIEVMMLNRDEMDELKKDENVKYVEYGKYIKNIYARMMNEFHENS